MKPFISDRAYYQKRNNRNQKPITDPHVSAVHHRRHEILSYRETQSRQEKRQTDLTKHHIGGSSRESDQVIVRSIMADEDRHDQ